MSIKYDKILGVIRESDAGGTGASVITGTVNTYAELPAASSQTGRYWAVLTSTGFLWNRRRGLYRSNGTIWDRLSNNVFVARTDEASILDWNDNTKVIDFDASNITTSNTRTIIMSDNNAEIGLVQKVSSDVQLVTNGDNINLRNGGLKDTDVIVPISLGDSNNTNVDSDFNNSSLLGVINENKTTFEDTREPTGFIDITESTISWSDSTPDRTFTITPVGISFSFYQKSKKYTKTGAESIQLTDTLGMWVIYYDNGTLSSINQPTNSQLEDIYLNKILVSYVYWNSTTSLGKLFEERHGCTMDGNTHLYLHLSKNLAYANGLALNNFVISSGALDTHAQFSVDSGLVFDEDISITTPTVASTVGLEIWYKSGSDWTWTTNSGFSVLTTGTGRLAYNDSGSQTEISNLNFVLCHVFAWNSETNKIIAIQGQNQYGTVGNARDGADTEITSLDMEGLLSPEMRPIGTVIFQTANGYGNAVKGRVRDYDSPILYKDFRLVPSGKWFL